MPEPTAPDSWYCISRDAARRRLGELSLVLTAVGIDNHIDYDGESYCLWVPVERASEAAQHLHRYRRENVPAPPPTTPRVMDSGWYGVLGYITVIWLLPSLEASFAFGWDWRDAGRMDAGRVVAGEWWRTITALTLHADLGHIVANSLFGAVFGLFVGRYLGSGFGWLLVLLAGALGNAVNAVVQPPLFRSIGASTATFAALGLVAAFVWRRGYYRQLDWRRSFAPLFAAICLLAFTGFGGENTDVLGHVWGFGAGITLGLLAAGFDLRRLGMSGQYLSAAAASGLLIIAWALAGG